MPEPIQDSIPEKVRPVYASLIKRLTINGIPIDNTGSEEVIWYGTWIDIVSRINCINRYIFANKFRSYMEMREYSIPEHINATAFQINESATFQKILQSLNIPITKRCLTQKQIVNILKREKPTKGRTYFLQNSQNDNKPESDIGKLAIIKINYTKRGNYTAEFLPYLDGRKLRKSDVVWLRSS